MKSNAPWSVKGIARDTREIAKEAARKEGKTLGEWLNQTIEESSNGGQQNTLTKELVIAVSHLNDQMVKGEETKKTQLSSVNRNITGLVERLHRLERASKQNVTDQNAPKNLPEILTRLEKVEEKANDSDRIQALRALEKAVGQMAVQFETSHKTSLTRIETTEQSIEKFTARLDDLSTKGLANSNGENGQDASSQNHEETTKALASIANSMTSLDARLDAIEAARKQDAVKNEAGSSLQEHIEDPHFAERTGKRLRVLGDEIKRGGDQIRSLETLISKLNDQIDAAEQRNAAGLQKVSDIVTSLRGQLQHNTPQKQIDPATLKTLINAEIATALTKQPASAPLMNKDNAQTAPLPTAQEDTAASQITQDLNDLDLDLGDDFHNEEHTNTALDTEVDFDLEDEAFEDTSSLDLQNQSRVEESHLATATKGSLYEEDEDITVETAISNFDDDTSHTQTNATTIDKAPASHPIEDDFSLADVELTDGELTADENETIKAEINQILDGGISPIEGFDEPVKEDASETEAFSLARNETVEVFDPFSSEEETLAPPLEAQTQTALETSPHDEVAAQNIFADSFDNTPHEEQGTAKAPEIEAETPIVEEPVEKKPVRKKATLGPLPRTPDGRIDVAKLTPKQKAILAARARKKREAKALQEQQTQEAATTNNTAYRTYDERYGHDNEEHGLFSRIKGMFSKNRTKDGDNENISGKAPTPQLKKKNNVIDENDVPNDAQEVVYSSPDTQIIETEIDDDRSALSRLFKTPLGALTLFSKALIGIVILGLILFLVTRFIFPGTPDKTAQQPAPSRPISNPVQNNAVVTQTPNSAADANNPIIPNTGALSSETLTSAPANENTIPAVADQTIRPEILFAESIEILNAEPTGQLATDAFNDLSNAASLGYPPAQFQLAEFYKNGKFTEQNSIEARKWFLRSATSGNVYAMHRLAYLYAEGEGGSADIPTAINWFEKAGNLGFLDSQFNLGAIFDPGLGNQPKGVQDVEKAYYWYALASLNGDGQAGAKAAALASRLTLAQKEQLDSTVNNWRSDPVNTQANQNLTR